MENDNYNDSNRRKRMHFSPNLLACVNNAIANNVLVSMEYESSDNEITERKVEPMALVYKNRKRNLVAWCHLRNDWRSFRLDRIEMIKLNKDSFNPRENFNVSEFEGDDDESASNED